MVEQLLVQQRQPSIRVGSEGTVVTATKNFSANSFSTGRCCIGDGCVGPELELRKCCPSCDGWIHVPCGRVLLHNEGVYISGKIMIL